jgi:hypothetical protein
MNEMYSKTAGPLLGLRAADEIVLGTPVQYPLYTVFFIPHGAGRLHADFAAFNFRGPVLLFSTPLQVIYISEGRFTECKMLQFHGDFYCIEFHRQEVSCNGVLFNNIYIDPVVVLSDKEACVFNSLLTDLSGEMNEAIPSEITLRAYLQLFLAKASSIKLRTIDEQKAVAVKDDQMDAFKNFLDEHFLTLHKPSDYAKMLAMTPDNFSRRCVRHFGKTPSQLIQERLILEH